MLQQYPQARVPSERCPSFIQTRRLRMSPTKLVDPQLCKRRGIYLDRACSKHTHTLDDEGGRLP